MTTNRFALIILTLSLFIVGCSGPNYLKSPELQEFHPLTIIYPRSVTSDTLFVPADSVIFAEAPDSLFLLGHVVDPKGNLFVNGRKISIHKDGGWLAWVKNSEVRPIPEGSEYGAGDYSTVTIRYEWGRNKKKGAWRHYKRTIYFVNQEEVGPLPDEFAEREANETVLVVSPLARIRVGWPGAYDMFPSLETKLTVIGEVGIERPFWKVDLGSGKIGWIEKHYVEITDEEIETELPVIYSVKSRVEGRNTILRIPIGTKLPYRIEQIDDTKIEMLIYGAVSWTDQIIQPAESKVVSEARWSQVDNTTFKLTVHIKDGWFWGWNADFDDYSDLIWTIRQAPDIKENPFEGLTIVVDPGHGGANYSAIGPTGMMEKTANLLLSQNVVKSLEKTGARVIVTRRDDSYVSLSGRVEMAIEEKADILISLHYNALPQGTNPGLHHGSSTHYYQMHSKPLADALYSEMCRFLKWDGNKVRYQDLAMVRPTNFPAVLIETAFMMHPEEEALAKKKRFRKKAAQGITFGIREYLLEMARKQGKVFE